MSVRVLDVVSCGERTCLGLQVREGASVNTSTPDSVPMIYGCSIQKNMEKVARAAIAQQDAALVRVTLVPSTLSGSQNRVYYTCVRPLCCYHCVSPVYITDCCSQIAV